MEDHKCRRCGKCCTQFEPSKPGAPGGLLLTPEEASLFRGIDGKDVIPTVAYLEPGAKRVKILYYGMVNTTCPLYEDGCTVYDERPLVCRRYPLGCNIYDVNGRCPSVQDAEILFDSEELDAMYALNLRSVEIAASIPVGSIIYVWNMEYLDWDIEGVKI